MGANYCKNCGTLLPANSHFCPNCGSKIDDDTDDDFEYFIEQSDREDTERNQKVPSGWPFIILWGLILGIVYKISPIYILQSGDIFFLYLACIVSIFFFFILRKKMGTFGVYLLSFLIGFLSYVLFSILPILISGYKESSSSQQNHNEIADFGIASVTPIETQVIQTTIEQSHKTTYSFYDTQTANVLSKTQNPKTPEPSNPWDWYIIDTPDPLFDSIHKTVESNRNNTTSNKNTEKRNNGGVPSFDELISDIPSLK